MDTRKHTHWCPWFPQHISHPVLHPDPHHSRQENCDVSVLAPHSVREEAAEVSLMCEWQSPGSAAGERLTWPVWSWKLTRLHWKWLLLGMAFILVYLLCVFFKPFLKVFLFCFRTNGSFFLSCVYVCLQEHLYIPFSCFLSLQGKVVTFWCRLWILMKSSCALGKRCLFK